MKEDEKEPYWLLLEHSRLAGFLAGKLEMTSNKKTSANQREMNISFLKHLKKILTGRKMEFQLSVDKGSVPPLNVWLLQSISGVLDEQTRKLDRLHKPNVMPTYYDDGPQPKTARELGMIALRNLPKPPMHKFN